MKAILDVITKIYEDEELRQTCIPLFLSYPGIGKTEIIKQFAKDKGVKCLDIIASQLMPHEVSGMLLPVHEQKEVEYFDTKMFTSLQDGDILFFDELLNANAMVLNACLTILENRQLISGKSLPKIMIVAAANPQGATIITPQIKERFIWYDIKFDRVSWKQYMSKFLITDSIYDQLCVLIQNETFNSSDKNFYTPRSIVKAIKMMINDIPTPYSSKLSPILNNFIENTSGQDMVIGDYIFKANENLSWLNLQKMIKNANTTK
jgi:alkaline phosphatase D